MRSTLYFFTVVLCLFTSTSLVNAQLYINEVLAKNVAGLQDEAGQFEDWIEIYNAGNSPVDIGGYHISDDPTNITLWQIPTTDASKTTVPAGGYLILWADADIIDGENHVDFSLSKNGGTVTLYNGGTQVDAVTFGTQSEDISFGRATDGDDSFLSFSNPSPKAGNAGTPPENPFNGLVISELMTNNHIHLDEYGEGDDWVEFYNPTNQVINFTDFYLTDDFDNLKKWAFPAGYHIDANNYSIVWVDSDSEQGTSHASFKLGSTGSELALVYDNGSTVTILDSITVGKQPYNASFGRNNDSGAWTVFHEISQGYSNIGKQQQVTTPIASIEGGIYATTQNISLSTSTTGASIYYTTNGDEPTQSSTLYNGSFNVSSNKTIRARAFKSGNKTSDVVTNTYIFENAANLPIVMLSTAPDNLFDDEIGIAVEGTNGVSGNCFNDANWNQDWERPVHIAYYEADGSLGFETDAGISISGNCSRKYAQKSFNINARNQYGGVTMKHKVFANSKTDDFKALKLRASGNDVYWTMLRDHLASELVYNKTNVDAQAAQPAAVYLNGEYWGLYKVREILNEHYFAEKFPEIDKDNLDITRFSYQHNFFKVAEGTDEDYKNLDAWLRNHNLSNQADYNYAASKIDVDNFLDYNIGETFLTNYDYGENNVRVWRERTPEGKYRHCWFDFDSSMGVNSGSLIASSTDMMEFATKTTPDYWEKSSLFLRKMLENEEFKNEYIQRYATQMNLVFTPEIMNAKIDEIKAQMEGEMPAHIARWKDEFGYEQKNKIQSVAEWSTNIQALRTFLNERPAHARQHITDYFGLNGTFELMFEYDENTGGTVHINSNEYEIPFKYTGEYYDNIPIKVKAKANPGYTFSHWAETGETSTSIEFSSSNNTTLTPVFSQLEEPVITEIHYNPSNGSSFEYIELHNPHTTTLNIANYAFTSGISYTFPAGTSLAPNEYLLVVQDAANYTGNVLEWTEGTLSNSGEKILLANAAGGVIDSVKYNDAAPWPVEADGLGKALILISATLDNAVAGNWVGFEATPGIENLLPPSCTDGIQNGDEAGIDCGGSFCNPCPSCTDGIQNGDETGVDCGGINCPSCPLTYCGSNSTNANYEYIDKVVFGDINNTTGANGGYGDFTGQSTTVVPGDNIAIALTPGHTNTAYDEYWNVWIDFNLDGDFEDADELVFQANGTTAVNGTISIPANAAYGSARMRISMKWNAASTPCETIQYGEVEDYMVFLDVACAVGTACDDGDPCTAGETYDSNCNCSGGSFLDADSDGVCDTNDICAGDDTVDSDSDGTPDDCDGCDNNLTGTACDDGNACTTGETYDVNCNCTGGTVADADGDGICDADDICPAGNDNVDSDNDGIPDACDVCNDALVGTACDDGDVCTTGEMYDANCNCTGGIFADADNDSVCDANDICAGDDTVDVDGDGTPDACDTCDGNLLGTTCDDGDACTAGETYDADCNCTGGTLTDADGDGVCDLNDICAAGDDNIDGDGDGIPDACDTCNSSLVGTACDDGDVCTTGETYDASCNCIGGTFADADNDSVCDANDICAGDDTIDTDGDGTPDACDNCDSNLAGTTCDDGDACTTGETYDANCNCTGGTLADADADGVCDLNDICAGDDTVDTDGDGTPDDCDTCDGNLLGTSCDDGDPCTVGEAYDANCNCTGGTFEDTDTDGVCDFNDICSAGDDAIDTDGDGVPDACDSSCGDGIQNGSETGVDCGGPECPECPTSMTDYCSANGTNVNYEYIENVTFGSINNTSGASGGYGDFTAQSTDVSPGDNIIISLTPRHTNTAYNEAWNVWIDFNMDGDFEDISELVYTGSGTSTVSGIISIPANIALGTTRMRVGMQWNNAPSPCGSFQYGEVEDYTVIIVEGANTFAPTELATTEFWLEAECGVPGANWSLETDGTAAGGAYGNPTGAVAYDAPSGNAADVLTFTFDVSEAGNYKVFGRAKAPNSASNSLWVRANGGTWVKWFNIAPGTSFNWLRVKDYNNNDNDVFVNLAQGSNTVEVATREAGTLLDKLYLTKTGSLPTLLGGASTNCGTNGDKEFAPLAIGETGKVSIDQNNATQWQRIEYRKEYTNPVVVAQSLTYNDEDPATVSIRNIDADGFELKINEWDYQDGTHAEETIGFMVVEAGSYQLEDGQMIQAGISNMGTDYTGVTYDSKFNQLPVVIGQVVSNNNESTVVAQTKAVSTAQFKMKLTCEEGNVENGMNMNNEQVAWIAMEAGKGTTAGNSFEAGNTGTNVDTDFYEVEFDQNFMTTPVVVYATQTNNENNAVTVRHTNITPLGFDVRLQEETSFDAEQGHSAEEVGFIAFEQGFILASQKVENNPIVEALETENNNTDEIACHIEIPNTFTPNGDGINDAFQFDLGTCATSYEMTVFNRNGSVIFTDASDVNNIVVWNGEALNNNASVSEGTYFYVLTFEVEKEMKRRSGYIELRK